MSFVLHVATRSNVGLVRTRNEDAVDIDPDRGILIVADGMGGHPAGDVASRLATAAAIEVLVEWDPTAAFLEPTGNGVDEPTGKGVDQGGEARSPSPLGLRMAEAVSAANQRILDEVERNPERAGMGTTLTALLVDRVTGRWGIGHIGDSRAYRFAGGELQQITRDDSWVQEQVEAGAMTPERAREHPYANVLSRALGLDRQVEPRVYEGRVAAGDLFLLCTDGLSGMVDDARIRTLLGEAEDVDDAAEELVEAAREAGGLDNITVGMVRITESS